MKPQNPRPGTAGEALEEIRAQSTTHVEKGHAFERLVAALLPDLPEYGIEEIWPWNKLPNIPEMTNLYALFGGSDSGTDLVARRKDGGWTAIQCKCYAEDHRVDLSEVSKFLQHSSRKPFTSRLFIATCPWTAQAEKAIIGQEKDIRRVDFHQDLADTKIVWKKTRPQAVIEPRKPWPLQEEAIQDGIRHFDKKKENEEAGILHMACGTGKTFVSLKIMESITPKDGIILFAAPSLALISQTHREWLRFRDPASEMNTVIVCSDRTAGRSGSDDISPSELAFPPTTDPEAIAGAVAFCRKRGGRTVIFSTFQSLEKIAHTWENHSLPEFSLAVCDEAHRTAGSTGTTASGTELTSMRLIHDRQRIPAEKRLYMTATPRVYEPGARKSLEKKGFSFVDMDDTNIYGRKFHVLGFRKAVEAGILTDFRVIVMAVDENSPEVARSGLAGIDGRDPNDIAIMIGTCMALNGCAIDEDRQSPPPMRRVLAFARTIARSKRFKQGFTLPEIIEQSLRHSPVEITADHVDGTNTALQRNRALRKLQETIKSDEDGTGDRIHILCNAQLLSEGIDVRNLDAVVFLDSKDSQIQITQAVGRIMRSSPGKRYGYVVIPTIVPLGSDPDKTLDADHAGFRPVWRILAAMRSHDSDLARELEGSPLPPAQRRIQIWHAGPSGNSDNGRSATQGQEIPPHLPLQLRKFSDNIYPRIIRKVGTAAYDLTTAGRIDWEVRKLGTVLTGLSLGNSLAHALGTTPEQDGKDSRAALIASLLVFNACLLHSRLDGATLKAVPALRDAASGENPVRDIAEAWKAILVHDYRPVFEIALNVLECLPDVSSPTKENKILVRALKQTVGFAQEIVGDVVRQGFDHAGKLYHRILPGAASDGAFYTNNISAALLADLALDASFCDWKDPEAIARLKIIDPACGTGTLLMAALRQIQQNHGEKVKVSVDTRNDLHRRLVENVLHGLDINPHGIQMTALNLTLGEVSVNYQKMNLHTMPHGLQETGSCKAGSLEILDMSRDSTDLMPLMIRERNISDLDAVQVDSNTESTGLKTGTMDLVIMNPPFTDNVKKGSKFTPEIRHKMQKREYFLAEQIAKHDPEADRVINSNSIGTYFTPIADMLLSDSGKLAKIIPTTACLGQSGLEERKFLASRFQIDLVITSHDPDRPNFSENTDIHETLFVARKSPKGTIKSTRFVSIKRMPQSADEASQLADVIRAENSEAMAKWGTITEWPAEEMQAGNWRPTQWYNHSLIQICEEIERSPAICSVSHRFQVGPAGQGIRGTFNRIGPDITPESIKAFWSISSKLRQTMNAFPEENIVAKPEKENSANQYKKQRSKLLVNSGLDTMAGRITSLYSEKPSFGSGWVPVSVQDEDHAKALCAWFNSTPGVLGFLNRRSKKLTYPKFSIAHLSSLPVPDFEKVSPKLLLEAFEQVKDRPLRRFREIPVDPARQILDRAATETLRIPSDEALIMGGGGAAEMLSMEPTICNAVPE